MPIKMYTELDLTFLGLKVLKVGVFNSRGTKPGAG